MNKITTTQLFKNVKNLVESSRQELYIVANVTLAETYFHVGKLIIEFEQQGSSRAAYAKQTLIKLSAKLTLALGKGFSVDNLENMRKFYLVYKDDYFKHISKNQKSEPAARKLKIPSKSEPPIRKYLAIQKSEPAARKLRLSPFKLSWTHYVLLLKIENPVERKFYEIEATMENWNKRELQRQYESALFERLALSRNKAKVKELGKKGQIISSASDAIKDPYILEFLDLHEKEFYSENDLENAIINKLEQFLRELGKGFLFVERQKRIKIDNDDDKIDLFFYHRILRCFVLIDLKIGTLQNKDLGQMLTCLPAGRCNINYCDEEIKAPEENKTMGIILCKNKKESTIKYTLGKGNTQIFASKYRIYFPEKQIFKLIREQ